jgi:hypothetical protein
MPAVSNVSLTVNGTPCSGPSSSPRSTAASAAPARSSASGASVTIAFRPRIEASDAALVLGERLER